MSPRLITDLNLFIYHKQGISEKKCITAAIIQFLPLLESPKNIKKVTLPTMYGLQTSGYKVQQLQIFAAILVKQSVWIFL